MTYDNFIRLVNDTKKNKPVLFGLESDKSVSKEEISQYEEANGIIFPDEYKRFVEEFGGGYFGFTTIYSLDKDSSFYLFRNQTSIPLNCLAISDDGCGNYYVLKITDGTVHKEVFFFEHEEKIVSELLFEDIYEFLIVKGLNNG